jgi:tetratricopeptide (TPR) repeat protein
VEKYQKHGINPLLISIATSQELDSALRPAVAMLPSKYAKLVYKNMNAVNEEFPENISRLTCQKCGKSGDYDLGTLVFPLSAAEPNIGLEKYQSIGYFRCKHCNTAGEWELSPRVKTMLAGKMASAAAANAAGNESMSGVVFGEALIDKSFAPCWGSDTESYFFKKLTEKPNDAYLWNRLGNAYYRGKRPELAVTAHEQAIANEPGQVESHFSLGKILIACGELELAAVHLRQAVAFSYQYKYLPAYDLREIIVAALEMLLTIYKQSDNKIDILPKPNEQAMLQQGKKQIAATAMFDFDIDAESRETLYPLAEVYLGERRNELLPEQSATTNWQEKGKPVWPVAAKPNKQKPSKKNKKKKR